MKKNKQNLSGFTLVEIMISIAIVGILSVIGVVSYNSAQKSNRDQARVRDLQIIKQALELYRNDYGTYPVDATTALPPPNGKYLVAWPTDPVGQSYFYKKTPTGFVVCATREGNLSGYLLSQCTSLGYNIGFQSD